MQRRSHILIGHFVIFFTTSLALFNTGEILASEEYRRAAKDIRREEERRRKEEVRIEITILCLQDQPADILYEIARMMRRVRRPTRTMLFGKHFQAATDRWGPQDYARGTLATLVHDGVVTPGIFTEISLGFTCHNLFSILQPS